MAELFDCSSDNISLHLKNIFKEEELLEEATTEIFSVVQKEGNRDVKRNAKCYNLDAIIAVDYRVNSKKATKFRQWATKTLKEYITKGFVLNDDMLKNGKPFGKDYFDELLERIREIRASERRAYQKISTYSQWAQKPAAIPPMVWLKMAFPTSSLQFKESIMATWVER